MSRVHVSLQRGAGWPTGLDLQAASPSTLLRRVTGMYITAERSLWAGLLENNRSVKGATFNLSLLSFSFMQRGYLPLLFDIPVAFFTFSLWSFVKILFE